MSKVSIAIPTYNRVDYLKECVESILNQTFQDFSVFVFDNASEQPVKEEMEKFGDERIKFIGNDKNIGSAGNINRILEHSFDSEYLIVFHDDDLMHPMMLEIEISLMESQQEAVFLVSNLNRVSDENAKVFSEIEKEKMEPRIYENNSEFAKAIMNWTRFAFDSAVYRIKFINEDRMNFNRFSDLADIAFLAGLSQKGPSIFVDAPLVNYRVHPGQDSKSFKGSYRKGALEALSFLKEILSSDRKFFFKHSLNLLLYFYTYINQGWGDFSKYLREARDRNFIKYRNFAHIDLYGLVSLASIIFKSRKVFDIARFFRRK